MANDARTQFVDGLRVTADHLQHLQDRLRESMRDVRQTIGFRKIAWGLHVTAADGSVSITPGVAFAPSGVRLNIDSAANLPIPAGAGPWRVTLKATEQDRVSLRVGDKATLISLITAVAIEPASDPDPGADALVIATLQPGEVGFRAVQDPDIFAVTGHHAHSGEFRQDADGRWFYDGPNVEGEQGPKGDKGDKGDKGAKGDTGDAGVAGAPGAKGDKGDPGTAGAAGAKGDKGDPGAAGAAGAKGDKGDPGTAAATGAKGDKGDPGTAGAAGAKGDKGDPGTAGAAGAKGDKGDPGAAGAKGDKGDPGAAGAAGATGPKGDKGDPGAAGASGTTGAKGDKGDPGAAGAPGATGAKGDKGDPGIQGPPGPGLDPDPTILSKIAWPLGQTVPMQTAMSLLTKLRIDFSGPLDDRSVADQTQVVQVWFLGNTSQTGGAPVPIQIVHGTTQLAVQALQWTATETAAQLRAILGTGGGQVLLRVHCGYLFDNKQRPLSAALNVAALMPNKAPVYGGVFEGWFFVALG